MVRFYSHLLFGLVIPLFLFVPFIKRCFRVKYSQRCLLATFTMIPTIPAPTFYLSAGMTQARHTMWPSTIDRFLSSASLSQS